MLAHRFPLAHHKALPITAAAHLHAAVLIQKTHLLLGAMLQGNNAVASVAAKAVLVLKLVLAKKAVLALNLVLAKKAVLALNLVLARAAKAASNSLSAVWKPAWII